MSQPTRRLVNLLHFRPVGIKGWEYDPYHDETLTRLFKAQPLPPLEPDDPTVLTATSPKPETSSNSPQKPTCSRPDTTVSQESESHPDPVQINRIDWLPIGWPRAIPAPVDLTPDSLLAFCDYLDNLVSCLTYQIAQANGPDFDLSLTDESLAIIFLAKALQIPSPFGLTAQSGNQRDKEQIQKAVDDLRKAVREVPDPKTTQNATTKKTSKKRPMNAKAADCARRYREANYKTPMKTIVEDYVEEWGGKASSIMRVLNDNPDQWKDDKKTTI